ncbi:VPLPA-CTERM sorting domain-containing protein [Roseobacter ponti]|uniref:VPLPA-CTERM sorting domain-containing protein n=1 Tax=Roseobacter ponti TaxID=1891787 RepID=A0A858ST13_9RHOB|nr:VPLPA-CTERM sorting domain-containing protein [Roseobacter ponti]QJF52049.1 VPLPA-CTERM sorting domain-containing protein [Roseobacter ponti]
MRIKGTIAAAATAVLISASGLMAATTGMFEGEYDVSNADNGQHGVWLKNFITGHGGAYNYWGVEQGHLSYHDGEARLTATVENQGDNSLQLYLDMVFMTRHDFAGAPKCEWGDGCPPSAADWEYFSISSGTLSGIGSLSGLELTLSQFPDPSYADHPPQLGVGANSKSKTELGFASWLAWSGLDASGNQLYDFDMHSQVYSGQHGDINIALEAVPLPAAGWLLFAAVGGLAAAGRRKS